MLLNMDLAYRVKSEGLAIFAKSATLYLLLLCDLKLLSFALAQLIYCLVLLGMYRYQSLGEPLSKYYQVKKVTENRQNVRVFKEHKNDLWEFSMVCVVKFVLTEGEKFIIFAFRDFVSNFKMLTREYRGLQCRLSLGLCQT
jgi:hypothetical protein